LGNSHPNFARQIPAREFSMGRRMILLLRSGASADRRKLFRSFSDGGALPRRRYAKSRLSRRNQMKVDGKRPG